MNDPELLQNICENPQDDAAKLVYSDWLEEHGDLALAEFIRIQCKLAQLKCQNPCIGNHHHQKHDCDKCDACHLRRAERTNRKSLVLRVKELLKNNRNVWTTHAQVIFKDYWREDRVIFSRGFVSTIRCTVREWVTYGKALVRCYPISKISCIHAHPFHIGEPQKQTHQWTCCHQNDPHKDICMGSSWEIPREIFTLLDHFAAYDANKTGPWERKEYSNAQKAIDALQEACLVWAREKQ